MQKKLTKFSSWTFIFMLILSSTFAQETVPEWKQFRGNNRDGISPEKGLLTEWPEDGPELVWRKKITDSFSELAISEGIIYTTSGDTLTKPGSEYIGAYKVENGEEIWKTKIDSIFVDPDNWGNGPRSTPYVDDEMVYVQSSWGKMVAVDKKNGKVKWEVSFMQDFGTLMPRWGYSISLAVVNDVVLTYGAGKENFAYVALDKNTGKVLWTKGTGAEAYTSPSVVNIDGKTNIVFMNDTMMYSFNEKGEELWSHRMAMWAGNAMPTFIEPNKFFVSRVSRVGSFLMEINGNETKEIWTNPTMQANWSSSVHKDGYVYGFSKGKIVCISLEDGSMKWSMRGYGKGSLVLVDDLLIAISERGIMKLVEANPEAYTVKGSFQPIKGKTWTAPSIYDGKVFLRGMEEMVVYKIK
jgi:outer membrane protein assembly factor BamB